jgi:hypothetical protein
VIRKLPDSGASQPLRRNVPLVVHVSSCGQPVLFNSYCFYAMKLNHSFINLAITSIVVSTVAPSVWATHDGICRTKTTVINNPYSTSVPKKALEAWKLMGEGACSGTRISKEWIIGSAHCFFPNNSGINIFVTEFGEAPVDIKTCSHSGLEFGYYQDVRLNQVNDISVCRLMNTGTLPDPVSYPALVVMPEFNKYNAGRFGGLLIGGGATWGINQCPGDELINPKHNQVGLVDLNGIDIGNGPLDPTTLSGQREMPYVVGGDSGGAAFWLPPNGQEPALVGVISQVTKPGGFEAVPWYFTADNLNKVVAYIRRVGQPTDQVPVIRTTPDYFVPTGPAMSPGMMATSPTVVATSPVSNQSVTVTWTPPATTAVAIDSYRVTLAQNGVLKSTLWVPAGKELTASFDATKHGLITSANGRVCVTPSSDAAGLATSAIAKHMCIKFPDGGTEMCYAKPVVVGCTDFNNDEAPMGGVTSLSSVITARTTTSSTIRTSWIPRDQVAKVFRVTQTTTFPSGPKRVTVKDVTSLSVSAAVTKGATLCTLVTPMSAIKLAAASSSTTCVVSN